MNKIGLDLRILDNTTNITGIGRYSLNLSKALINLNNEIYSLMGNFGDRELLNAKKITVDFSNSDIKASNKLLSIKGIFR